MEQKFQKGKMDNPERVIGSEKSFRGKNIPYKEFSLRRTRRWQPSKIGYLPESGPVRIRTKAWTLGVKWQEHTNRANMTSSFLH